MIGDLRRAATMLRRELDADTVMLLVGLLLLATGFWNFARPLSFIVPGAILIYICLPQRVSFFRGTDDDPVRKRQPRPSGHGDTWGRWSGRSPADPRSPSPGPGP